jgi:hypothetical protein
MVLAAGGSGCWKTLGPGSLPTPNLGIAYQYTSGGLAPVGSAKLAGNDPTAEVGAPHYHIINAPR